LTARRHRRFLVGTVDKETVLNILRRVKYPGYSRDIVSFGLVREIAAGGGKTEVALALSSASPEVPERLREEVLAALREAGAPAPAVTVENAPPARATGGTGAGNTAGGTPQGGRELPPARRPDGVRRVIAVASGKGGVGKSTLAVNLACALARRGLRVGLLDCDLHGPSVPRMTGLEGRLAFDGERMVPHERFGVRVMSIGFLVDEETPLIWRGPMITSAIRQLAFDVAWGELDALLVDLPPGTGDAPLSLAQMVALDGALIVTTPQPAAAAVALRGAALFPKVGVPVLGVVENMSWLELPADGGRATPFGAGGGAAVASALGAPLLGQVPLDERVRTGGDDGEPVAVAAPESTAGAAFAAIAGALAAKIDLAPA